MKTQNIAILCGGQSAEHEVSLLSASNIARDLDATRFNKIIIYITKSGRWLLVTDHQLFLQQAKNRRIETSGLSPILLQPGVPDEPLVDQATGKSIAIDCVFPVLHGASGEDGTMQGLLQILNVPFVGCDTISSAVCMEKHIVKQLLRHAGIPTLDWIALHRNEKSLFTYAQIKAQLGSTVFMKTVNSGSSIGVYKVRNEQEYIDALDVIFNYDDNIIIEKGVSARELEVSVLGNEDIATTAPGEVLVYADFYTYEAKYFDVAGSKVVTPAEVSDKLNERLQSLAAKAFSVLRCKGMARVDFLVVNDDDVYLNEINTLPGFTDISMYPKNWQVSGLDYKSLLSRLIDMAYNAYASRVAIQQAAENFVTQKKEQQSAL